MKIVIPAIKPRAKHLNDVLLSKKCARHASSDRPSRAAEKKKLHKELNRF